MPEIEERIDRFLAKHLGESSTDSEWRKELAEHLADAYENCLEEGLSPDEAWRLATERLGDVRGIGEELESIHSSVSFLSVSRKALIIILLVLLGAPHGGSLLSGLIDLQTLVLVVATAYFGAATVHLSRFAFQPRETLTVLRSQGIPLTVPRGYVQGASLLVLCLGSIMAHANLTERTAIGYVLSVSMIPVLYGFILTRPSRLASVALIACCHLSLLSFAVRFDLPLLGAGFWSRDLLTFPAWVILWTFALGWLYWGHREFPRRLRQFSAIAATSTLILVLRTWHADIGGAVPFPQMGTHAHVTSESVSLLAIEVSSLLPLLLFLVPLSRVKNVSLRRAS